MWKPWDLLNLEISRLRLLLRTKKVSALFLSLSSKSAVFSFLFFFDPNFPSFLLLYEACTILNHSKGKFWKRPVGSSEDFDYNAAVSNKTGFLIKARTKKYYLLTDSHASTQKWISAIRVSFFLPPLFSPFLSNQISSRFQQATKEWNVLLEQAGVSEVPSPFFLLFFLSPPSSPFSFLPFLPLLLLKTSSSIPNEN